MIGLADPCNRSIGPYLQQGDVSRGLPRPMAHQVAAIIFKPFREVKPVGNVSSPLRVGRQFGGAGALNAEIAGLNLFVGAQFLGFGRIHHLALAHHMHVVDELECKIGILLHEQNGKTFLLQRADGFP